jgi:hypothetical protein
MRLCCGEPPSVKLRAVLATHLMGDLNGEAARDPEGILLPLRRDWATRGILSFGGWRRCCSTDALVVVESRFCWASLLQSVCLLSAASAGRRTAIGWRGPVEAKARGDTGSDKHLLVSVRCCSPSTLICQRVLSSQRLALLSSQTITIPKFSTHASGRCAIERPIT